MQLITWNVQWFCGVDGKVDVRRVVDEARAMADFNVLCLQEVAVHYPLLAGGADFDQVEQLRALLPGYQVFFGAAVDELGDDGRRQRFGNLIATRLPVLQVQHHALPYPADGGVRTMPRMATCVTLATSFGPVRIMTTHLEFYSTRQRMAQTRALHALHAQACAHAHQPPLPDRDGSPFQGKTHTPELVLCGDFNFEPDADEYTVLQQPTQEPGVTRLHDAWTLQHGTQDRAPTFRLFDRRYGPVPITSDYLFVSDGLRQRVRAVTVNLQSQASDHQPVLLTLA